MSMLKPGWQNANSNAQTDNNLRGMRNPLPASLTIRHPDNGIERMRFD
jgi:hypothetical protein